VPTSRHGSGLGSCPGAETATVSDAKLEYLLNPDPEVFGGKAQFFSGLGFTASNSDELRTVMISKLTTVSAEAAKENAGGGVNYVARMTIEGPGGSADVQTVWAVNPGEETHLVTAYPARAKRK
jgi:hypothetical protein